MPCKIEIRKKIESSVEQLTDPAIGLSLDLSNKKANEVNKLFDHTVVKFVISGDVIERDIFIPESLIQIYYDNELEMEKQEAARLLKEEEEKERKYVESKKEEWEENREYFENDEPFTRASAGKSNFTENFNDLSEYTDEEKIKVLDAFSSKYNISKEEALIDINKSLNTNKEGTINKLNECF
jgi:hypothetical protein